MKTLQLFIAMPLCAVILSIVSCSKDDKDIAATNRETVAGTSKQDRTFIVIAQEGEKADKIAESLEGLKAVNYKVKGVVPELGLIYVQTPDPTFPERARKITGVQSVVIDIKTDWQVPVKIAKAPATKLISKQAEASKLIPAPTGDPYGVLQWDMQSVSAYGAWAKGYKGNGAKVAILDGGFLLTDGQTASQVTDTLNLVPDEPFEPFPALGQREYVSRGAFSAGIIAAAHDGREVVGIAPEAKLILIKILSDNITTPQAPWSTLINGICYAVKKGANVIQMNVAGKLPRKTYTDDNGTPSYPGDDYEVVYDRDVKDLVIALNRATIYANLRGATLVAPAGDDRINFDTETDFAIYPAAALGVLCIGSNGPNGWGINNDTSLYVPSYFTNYGKSYVRFGAPGGNYDPRTDFSAFAEVAGFANYEYLFNYVYNTGFYVPSDEGNSPYSWWAYGSALAAAHATGVIALIYGKHPWANSVIVDAILRRSADDYGAPGKDPYFGYGQINAEKALSY
ncbi:S8 family peptidase [Chitinophaga tropicalis]|uniref:S8 family serine peptidase n=1 Tax=Chitinophaga tropicalis TaxID=2683588 RepID=A0A7K1U546_9BACT|nr:S8 family serine peptidase [Chitinophaga tropicalis]MVT09459.1 S8 family serine peptidase [Chitinophaga tropicalis]